MTTGKARWNGTACSVFGAFMLARIFWPLFFATLVIALPFLLWNGKNDSISYREMACVFEERAPGCLDSIGDWHAGLAYFDSSVAVNHDTLQSLKNLLWQFWNIDFAGAGEAAVAKDAVLPLRVLANKKSGCMGLSWLALMVAEARGLHLDAILLPGHVFLRYGSSDNFVNLEPNRRGFTYTDEEYREKYQKGPWTGLEFKPLETRQFIGLAAFDIGNLYLENDVPRALTWYRMAEEFFLEYPGISVNQTIAKSRLPDIL